ncbi:hypothetical protein MMC30_008318 [Trapelia coarctata]|nr:hypothetical protein [Trapelia coarctata]
MSDLSVPVSPGRFEPTEFEEWLNYDGALESLTPTSQSTSLHRLSTSIGSLSPLTSEPNLRANVAEVRDAWLPPPTANKKRKANDKGAGKAPQPEGKKTSHNVIEKRYRSNLNDKIAALRDSIPVLRSAARKASAKDGSSDSEGSCTADGPGSKLKFNKATVLTKATEYIKQLEKQNERLLEENSQLRNRLHNAHRPHSVSTVGTCEQGSPSDTSMTDVSLLQPPSEKAESITSKEPVVGMMPAPEEFRRMWAGASQEHYAPPDDDVGTGPRGRFMSRLLLGSLATLMVMEGISENEADRKSDGPGSRGLFALPRELLTESRGFREPIRRRIIAFISSMQGHQVQTLSKLLLLTILVLAFLVYILEFKYRSQRKSAVRNSSMNRTFDLPAGPVSRSSMSRSQSPSVLSFIDRDETAITSVRRFFARQAVGLLGHSWLEANVEDEEAASIHSMRAGDFRRRWKAYADLPTKLFEENHTD